MYKVLIEALVETELFRFVIASFLLAMTPVNSLLLRSLHILVVLIYTSVFINLHNTSDLQYKHIVFYIQTEEKHLRSLYMLHN